MNRLEDITPADIYMVNSNGNDIALERKISDINMQCDDCKNKKANGKRFGWELN